MSSFTAVDLSQLPPPQVVEPLDFETIFARKLAQLIELDPQFDALVESDPAYKILQVSAYDELLLRQRVNEAARAVMLAYAQDADLDQLAANFNVQRLLITPGNP
ncbi:MAG: baseplate assembly protein, partial [Halopseudomonas sp.]